MKYQNIPLYLGAEIRTQAAIARLKLKDVADRAGLTPSTLNRYLKGERDMQISTLFAIAEALNTDVRELLTRVQARLEQDEAQQETEYFDHIQEDYTLAALEKPQDYDPHMDNWEEA